MSLQATSRTSSGRGRLAAVVFAAGMLVPGAFITCTSAPAGAQPTDPVGPIVTQVEQATSTAVANAQALVAHEQTLLEVTVSDLEDCLGGLSPAYCGLPGGV